MFKLTLKGNKAVLKGLEKYKKEAIEMVGHEIIAAGEDIEAGAKNRAPHDARILINSIKNQPDEKNLRTRVESSVKYAPYVEFGTGGLVSVPAGLEEYAMKFKGKNDPFVAMPPQPFLFPSFEQERLRLIENIKKAIGSK